MYDQIFNPAWGSSTAVVNTGAATAAVDLPQTAQEVALTNTSATARVHVYVTPYQGVTPPTGTAPTTSNGMPVLPGQQIRVRVGAGSKVIRTISTAADGLIIITPGNGG